MHWIIIGDASRARVLTGNAMLDELSLVYDLEYPEGRQRGADLKSDRPGSTKGGHVGARSAMDSHSQPHDVEADRFARQLGVLLKANIHRYERLIWVAPPEFLGRMRRLVDPAVSARLVGEIGKDLTGVPVRDLSELLVRGLAPETQRRLG